MKPYNYSKVMFIRHICSAACSKHRMPDNYFSYMVALEWDLGLNPFDSCSGILISPKFVLIAAHCAFRDGSPPSYALIGENVFQNDNNNNEKLKIELVIIHPEYTQHAIYNDIALVKLRVESL